MPLTSFIMKKILKILKIIICVLCVILLVEVSILVINKFFHKDEVIDNTIELVEEDDSKDILEIDEKGITIVDDSEENVSINENNTTQSTSISNSNKTTSSNTNSSNNSNSSSTSSSNNSNPSSTSSNNNNDSSSTSSSDSNSNNDTPEPEEHTHEAIVLEAVEPTCENDGLTEGSKCKTCGAILQAQEVIPKLEHSYGNDGKCIRCGASSPDESNEVKLPKVKIK